jgi:bacterioferritin
VCVLRYRRHHFMAAGINADRIAARIVQLNGEPNFSPEGLASRSHAEYVEGETLVDMIKEDLVAERIAIQRPRRICSRSNRARAGLSY